MASDFITVKIPVPKKCIQACSEVASSYIADKLQACDYTYTGVTIQLTYHSLEVGKCTLMYHTVDFKQKTHNYKPFTQTKTWTVKDIYGCDDPQLPYWADGRYVKTNEFRIPRAGEICLHKGQGRNKNYIAAGEPCREEPRIIVKFNSKLNDFSLAD